MIRNKEEYKEVFKQAIPSGIYGILKKYKCIVAGGSLLSVLKNKPINDYDIYFRDFSSFIHVLDLLLDNSCMIHYVFYRSITLTYRDVLYQLLFFEFYKFIQDLFGSFDFSCCMVGYDFKDENIYYNEDFSYSVMSGSVKINPFTKYPINSILRIKKYQEKGFYFEKNELVKLLLEITNKKINSWEEFRAEVGGLYGIYINDEITSEDFSIDKVYDLIDNRKINLGEEKDERRFNISKIQDFLDELFVEFNDNEIADANVDEHEEKFREIIKEV